MLNADHSGKLEKDKVSSRDIKFVLFTFLETLLPKDAKHVQDVNIYAINCRCHVTFSRNDVMALMGPKMS